MKNNGQLNNIFLVAIREFKVRIQTKSTIITLVLMMIVLAGGGTLVGYFFGDDITSKGPSIAVSENLRDVSTALEDQDLQKSVGLTISVQTAEENKLEELVRSGDLDYAIGGTPEDLQLYSDGEPQSSIQVLIDTIAHNSALSRFLVEHNIDPAQLQQALKSTHLTVVDVSKAQDGGEFDFAGYIPALAVAILLFSILMGSGSLIAMGVVEEKSSRVVEILLATLRPSQLLLGKMLGILALSLVQFACYAGAAWIGLKNSHLMDDLSLDITQFGLWSIIWLLLGLATYPVLYAGVGALVDRQEEIGAMILPLMMLQMIPFYIGLFGAQNDPNASWIRIVSWLPFANCYVMPFRQAMTNVPTWESIAIVAVNLAFIPLAVTLGARLYRGGVMHTGGRLSVLAALQRGKSATS